MRVLHVGLGPLGVRVARDLHGRGLGRVVAAADPAPGIVGRPLAEVVEGASGDVRVRATVEEALHVAGTVDAAVVTTVSDLDAVMVTLRPLAEHGLAVASTCEELVWPWLRHPVHAQELHERAVRSGARLVGTGVNPGFLMDAFAVAATTVCREVRSVRIERIQDAAPRREPFQRKIGAGLDDAEFARRAREGTLRHVGLGESLHLLAHALGIRIERWDEEIEPVRAARDLESALGRIEKGRASGVQQVARAWSDGRLAVELVFRAAVGEPEPRDRVAVEGDPPLELEWKGGVHGDVATSAVVLNTLPGLREAAPGLHTMAELPLAGCIPASRARR